MYEVILFPTDGSDAADAALQHALEHAGNYGATLHVLYVADTNRDSVSIVGSTVVDALVEEGEAIVDTAEKQALDRGIAVESAVVQGDPSRTILDYVDAVDADLVVMGTHGRRGLDRILLGSVTDRVIRSCSAPVLVVREDDSI